MEPTNYTTSPEKLDIILSYKSILLFPLASPDLSPLYAVAGQCNISFEEHARSQQGSDICVAAY